MVCRFCSQWNPRGAVRCAFCRNVLDSDSDMTRQGRAVLGKEQIARIVDAGDGGSSRPVQYGDAAPHRIEDTIREWFELLSSHRHFRGIAMAVVVMLLFAFSRAC